MKQHRRPGASGSLTQCRKDEAQRENRQCVKMCRFVMRQAEQQRRNDDRRPSAPALAQAREYPATKIGLLDDRRDDNRNDNKQHKRHTPARHQKPGIGLRIKVAKCGARRETIDKPNRDDRPQNLVTQRPERRAPGDEVAPIRTRPPPRNRQN